MTERGGGCGDRGGRPAESGIAEQSASPSDAGALAPLTGAAGRPRRIGHKGAHAIEHGNTLESFAAGVEHGAEMIELDVLRLRDGHPDRDPDERSPLVVAHDWEDAGSREPLTLEQALDAFTRPPLDGVEIDLDLKLTGREDELVDAVREHGLLERAMVSTMYVESLAAIRELEPSLRRGWTYPKVTRAWDRKRWARPLVAAAMLAMRRRLPRLARRRLPELDADAMWVFHPLITAPLVEAVHDAGSELMAWTVDDPLRIRSLHGLGVDGICSNDPRLLVEI
jgi:glycerophosphoryl diester phosphodiesterase